MLRFRNSFTEITHTYKNVSLEAFGAYGEYLDNYGYKVTNSAEVDDHYTLELSKGNQIMRKAALETPAILSESEVRRVLYRVMGLQETTQAE